MEWTPSAVAELRNHIGLNQQAFGECLGYAESGANKRVSEIERGARPVSGMLATVLDLLADRHGYGDTDDGDTPAKVAERLKAATAAAVRALEATEAA